MDRFPKSIFVAGCCVLGLTLAMGWGGITTMIKGQVKKQVRLINHTDQYTFWKDFPNPVYLSVHLFNITNGNELAKGAKPVVAEVGPYVYLEKFAKTDIELNITTGHLIYKQLKEYYFQPDMSKGTEADMVTVMNVPFLGVASIAQNSSEGNSTLKDKWNGFLDKAEESLTVTHTVRELLFDGYSVEPLTVLFKDPMFEESQTVKIPESFADGKFGFFKNKNGSEHGMFEVKSGRNKSAEIAEIIRWNENPELPFWKDDACNQINGTDGTIFRPFINMSVPLYIFTSEMCRSLKLVYTETLNFDGLDAYRFRLAEGVFDGPQKNEENWCFCSEESEEKCQKNGYVSLSACNAGTPLFLSQPHFLGADEDVLNSVVGLSPKPEDHSSFYDLNPMSGYIFKASKRLQYGVELGPYENVKAVGKPAKAMVPIYWIQETIEPHEVNLTFLKVMNWIQQGWNMVRFGFVGFGGGLMFLGLVLAMTRRGSADDRVVLVK